jgi:sulfite reductase alpha subunit-like flavoprotein
MIMVGPGTGVVPFIGFMQDREMLKKNNPDMNLAPAYLYFGCRKSTSDFIYREEIAKYMGEGIVKDAYIAFSRDKPNTRTYV